MSEIRVMTPEAAEQLPGEKLIISPSSLYRRLGSRTGRLPSQKEFARLSRQNKFIWNVGGWRAGKTGEACVQGLMAALTHAGSLGAILRQVEASIEDSVMRTWFEICPPEVIGSYNSTKKHLYLLNGSQVIFRGFDKVEYLSKLRSVELDWFIVCQAEEISLENFRLLQSRLNGRHGPLKGWLEGNPPPPSHWLWREFVDEPKPGFAYVQSSTLENQPNLPEDYLADLLAVEDQEWVDRYVYGKRIAFRGLVFPEFDREDHVRPKEELLQGPIDRYLLLKDWGWSQPGCSLVVGITEDGQWRVIEEVYRRELPVSSPLPGEEDWLAIDRALVEQYGITEGYADPSRPEEIALYKRSGLPLSPGGNGVQEGIEAIRYQLSKETLDGKGLVISNSCVNLIRELENFKFRQIHGELTEVPMPGNDHGIDALKAGLLSPEASPRPERRRWISQWEEASDRTPLRQLWSS